MTEQLYASSGYSPPPQSFIDAAQQEYLFNSRGRRAPRPVFMPGDLGGFEGIGNQVLPHITSLGPNELAITQFNATRNVFDQLNDYQNMVGTSKAARFSRDYDANRISQIYGGGIRMASGQKKLTKQQQEQARAVGQMTADNMSTAIGIFGEDAVDSAMGSAGSATVMARRIHKAMQTAMDPTTGEIGYTANRSGRLSAGLYDQLYGAAAAPEAMRGIRAGQTGELFQELQSRGRLGRPLTSLSLAEQRGHLPKELDATSLRRITMQSGEVQAAIEAGQPVTPAMLSRTEAAVKATHKQLTDPNKHLTQDEVSKLTGGEAMLQDTEVTRLADKMRGMAKSVRAMQDLFGDAGKPNAPMREIVRAIENMTQGAASSMSEPQINDLIRKTQAIANKTGLGVDAVSMLQSNSAMMSRQIGGHGLLGVHAANDSLLHVQAMGDMGAFDNATWGSDTKEQALHRESSLRVRAANSAAAQQAAVVMRMRDTSNLNVKKDSELGAYMAAVQAGDATYTFKGKHLSVAKRDGAFREMLKRDSDQSAEDISAMMSDKIGNEEYVNKYNTGALATKAQGLEQRRMVAPKLARYLRGSLGKDINEQLLSSGAVQDNQIDSFYKGVASRVTQDAFDMDSGTFNDEAARTEALGASQERAIAAEIDSRMKDKPEKEREALKKKLTDTLKSSRTRRGSSAYAALNAAANLNKDPNNPADRTTLEDLRRHSNKSVQDTADKMGRDVSVEGLKRDAAAGFGSGDFLSRISDAMTNATGDESADKMLRTLLGTPDTEALKINENDGVFAHIYGLVNDSRKLDPVNNKDDFVKFKQNSEIIEALGSGGASAKNVLDKAKGSGTKLPDALRKDLEKIAKDPSKAGRALAKEKGYAVDAKVKGAAVSDHAKLAKKLGEISKGKIGGPGTRAELGGFLDRNAVHGEALLRDDVSMQQLGSGGLALVQETQETSAKIKELLANANKDGRQVSLSDYRDPNSKLTEKEQWDIEAGLKRNAKAWAEIDKRKATGMIAGSKGSVASKRWNSEETNTAKAVEALNKVNTDATGAAGMAPGDTQSAAANARMYNNVTKPSATSTELKNAEGAKQDEHIVVSGVLQLRPDGNVEAAMEGQRTSQKAFASGR